MSKRFKPLHFALFILLSSFSASAQNGSSEPRTAGHNPVLQNKVRLAVARDKDDVVSVSMQFVASGRSVKADAAEITAQFLSINKTSDGHLQFKAVGAPSILNMPSVDTDPASVDGVYASPTMTMRLANGAGGLWVTVRRARDGSAKEVKLRVPPAGGTTTAEIKWKD